MRECAGWGPRLLAALAVVLASGTVSAQRGAAQAIGRVGGEAAATILVPAVDAADG